MSEKLSTVSSSPEQPNHDNVNLSQRELDEFNNMVENYDGDQGALFDTEGNVNPDLIEDSNSTTDSYEGEQGALFDTEGNVNPDLIESTDTASEKAELGKPLSEYSTEELMAELAKRENKTETEDNAAVEAAEEQLDEQLDAQAEVEINPEAADYAESREELINAANTRVARAMQNVADRLQHRADQYENAGGLKGIARKTLRRIGRFAYRASGLQKVKSGIDAIGRGVDKVVDKADAKIGAMAMSFEVARAKHAEKREQRHKEAYARYIQRIKTYEQKQAQKQERKTARKERRKQWRAEKIESAREKKDAAKEMTKAGAKKVGRGALKAAIGTRGAAYGAVAGAVAGAKAGAKAELNR